jgi:hypothetical protein
MMISSGKPNISPVSMKSASVRQAWKALIKRESARRLARLGGTDLNLAFVARRQSEAR